jgi:hypothetical protein
MTRQYFKASLTNLFQYDGSNLSAKYNIIIFFFGV